MRNGCCSCQLLSDMYEYVKGDCFLQFLKVKKLEIGEQMENSGQKKVESRGTPQFLKHQVIAVIIHALSFCTIGNLTEAKYV